jgi:GPN-loop GTPase
VVVHLVDAHYITDPSKYISVLLLCLRSMLQLDLPHINVLSKIDLLNQYGPLAFNLDFYTEVQDLSHMLPLLETDPRLKKYAKLNEAIVELVDGFGLVAFETLCVEDKLSMTHLLQAIDRAGGYAFGEAEGAGDSVWTIAMRGGWGVGMSALDIQERWVDHREEYDEFERKKLEEEAKKAQEAAEAAEEF